MGQNVSSLLDLRPAFASDPMQRGMFIDFTKELFLIGSGAANAGAPTGTAGDINNLVFRNGHLQNHVIGTQTILGPVRTASGLNISQDLTDNDGIEYTQGCEQPANTIIAATAGSSRGTFKVGTDAPFYFRLKMLITDVSGADALFMGFRKAEIYQAAEDDYDEMAAIGNVSGTIKINTILNNAATSSTSTTQSWADAATKTLLVAVDSDGSLYGQPRAVYYEIDGAVPTALPTAVFKFDADELVIPFVYLRHDADVAEATTLVEWESGLLPGVNGGTLNWRLNTAKG